MKPFRILSTLRGGRALYRREHLEAVLDVLEASAFKPDRWSLEERGGLPYSRAELVEFGTAKAEPLAQTIVYVKRSKAPKMTAYVSLSDRPGIAIELDKKAADKYWPALFELADRLASAVAPDWGTCHILELPESSEDSAAASQDEIDGEIMLQSALLAPSDYYDHGPESLVMRTYIGPHFVAQLGQERVRNLPLEVSATDWGGFVVDLVPEPWKAELSELLPRWRAGMAELRPAEVLALPVIEGGRFRRFEKAPRSVITPS